jgi:hypothetical protein
VRGKETFVTASGKVVNPGVIVGNSNFEPGEKLATPCIPSSFVTSASRINVLINVS